jgi:hydrogenase/urease accessory protein HupE
MCFTARTGAWWNSIYLFVILYTLSTILALCGIRSPFAILALLLAVPSLGIFCIFAFDR